MHTSDKQAIKEHVEHTLSELIDMLDGIRELESLKKSLETARQKAE